MPCPGETHAFQIWGSIYAAAVLEDLLMGASSVAYEQWVATFATHAEEMAALRHRLRDHRNHLPFFQPER